MRIKYLAKILLSDINIHKNEVISEMRAYVNLPNDLTDVDISCCHGICINLYVLTYELFVKF
ncbi:hypothetical protein R6Q57_009236 [Mikania cordata]